MILKTTYLSNCVAVIEMHRELNLHNIKLFTVEVDVCFQFTCINECFTLIHCALSLEFRSVVSDF